MSPTKQAKSQGNIAAVLLHTSSVWHLGSFHFFAGGKLPPQLNLYTLKIDLHKSNVHIIVVAVDEI